MRLEIEIDDEDISRLRQLSVADTVSTQSRNVLFCAKLKCPLA